MKEAAIKQDSGRRIFDAHFHMGYWGEKTVSEKRDCVQNSIVVSILWKKMVFT